MTQEARKDGLLPTPNDSDALKFIQDIWWRQGRRFFHGPIENDLMTEMTWLASAYAEKIQNTRPTPQPEHKYWPGEITGMAACDEVHLGAWRLADGSCSVCKSTIQRFQKLKHGTQELCICGRFIFKLPTLKEPK